MEEKCEKNAKIKYFWTKTSRVYRYRLTCTGTGMQRVTCTGTGQRFTGTGCAVGNLYQYRSKLYRYRLFQQPCFDMFSYRYVPYSYTDV